jgi:hypothetical protein
MQFDLNLEEFHDIPSDFLVFIEHRPVRGRGYGASSAPLSSSYSRFHAANPALPRASAPRVGLG